MADFEPAIMIWHNGKIQIAIDIARNMTGLYKGTKIGEQMDDALKLMVSGSAELTKMTEEKNQKMFEEATNSMKGM